MSALGLEEPPGLAAAATADEDAAADAASAADSISVADEEPGGPLLTANGDSSMAQHTVNLDITDAAISQEIQPDVAPGGALRGLAPPAAAARIPCLPGCRLPCAWLDCVLQSKVGS